MAWTPPSDAVEVQASSGTTASTGWTPPSDAVTSQPAAPASWTPPTDAVASTPQTPPVDTLDARLAAQEGKRAQFAPGEELKKGAIKAAISDLPSLWEQAGIMKDVGAALTVKQRMDLFDKIDKGEITSNDQLRGLDLTTGQARSYLASPPETRAKLKGRLTNELANRKDFVKASIDTINAYKENAKKYAPRVEKASDIGSVADFTNFVANNIGSGFVQFVPLMLAAATTGGVGLGTMAVGMSTSEAVGNRLEFLEKELAQLPQDQRADAVISYLEKTGDTSLAVGIVAGALDIFLGPARTFVKQMASKTLKDQTRKEAVKAALKETPKTLGGEGLTGGLQESAQIAGKVGVDELDKFFTKETLVNVLDAVAAEFAGSIGPAGVNVGVAALRAEGAQPEVTQERIDPTMGDLDAVPPAPTTEARVAELAKKYSLVGMVESDAEMLARRTVAEQDAEAARAAEAETVVDEVPAETTATPTEETPTAEFVTEAEPTLESLTADLIDQGLPEGEARVLAQMRLDREKPIITQPTQAPSAIVSREAAPTLESLTTEFIDQGLTENEARVQAQLFLDRSKSAPTEGRQDVARPDAEPSGVSTTVPALAADDLSTAERSERAERDGVVPARQDVGLPAEREGKQPSAVEETVERLNALPRAVNAILGETKPTAVTETEAERIKAEDEQNAAYEAKKAKAQSIAESNASTAFDQVGEYANLDEALDSYRTNMADTLAEEGLRGDPDYDSLLNAANRAFDAEVTKRKGTTTDGTATTETVQTETQKQEAPAAKRGRPITLTPEQKAQRDKERKDDRASRGRHERAVNKAEASLQKALAPLDEGEFANDAELKEAQDDQRAERRNAVKELLKVSEDSGLKPEGKRARQILRDAKIPQTEIDDIKRGLARAKKALSDKTNLLGPVSSTERKGAAVTKADPAFAAFKTGAQAINHIVKTGTRFQKAVAQRLRGFVRDVEFVVLEQDSEVPAQLQQDKYAPQWERSRALYIENFKTGKRVVYVRGASFGNSQGANNVTVLHELLHAATVKKIALAQEYINKGINLNTPLVRAYQDLLDTMRAAQDRLIEMSDNGEVTDALADLYESTDGDIVADPREFLAYGMSDAQFQEFLMSAEGVQEDTSFFTRFVDSIRRMFGMDDSDVNALSDLIIATDSLLTSRIPRGEVMADTSVTAQQKSKDEESNDKLKNKAERSVKELDKDQRVAKRKVAESRMGTEAQAEGLKLMQLARDPKKALDALKSLWVTASYAQRQAMVKLPTLDILADWTKDSVPRIGDVQRHVQEMTGMRAKFLGGAQHVIEGLRSVFKALPQERIALENLVLETTLTRYDPDDSKIKVRNAALDADYKRLSPASQGAYRMLRDYYESVQGLFTLLLDQQIEGLTDVSADIKQNLMVMVRKSFETGDRIKPFFPLVRRGDFWVSTGKEEGRQFYMFESMTARDKFAKTLEGDVKTGNDVGELRRATQNSSALLKGLFDAIDKQDIADANVKENLKDAVYQIYLQTMPDQSFRKMFIHRKDRSGFSTDLVRNTASTASRMATQLAKLKYAPMLRNDLSAARSSIEGRPELTPFVQEAQRRVDSALSGAPGGIMEAVAGLANKASYLWYMSSAATALIQPFSIFISGLPILAANHGGNWLGAARELGKMLTYLNQYGITRQNADGTLSYTAPSIINNPNLSADEIRAVRAMTERGVEESTYTSMVWGYSRVPSADIDSVVGKGKRAADILVGGLMHNTERLTREIVYLASYRLGKKRGLTTDEAINQAVADTNEALSDYDVTNRPLWMQKGLGKIAFQFKVYPLHMTLLSLTNFKRMMPFLNKEGRLVAAQKFFGLMGTSAMLAGASNMLFFSPIMALVGWAWKQMEDDDELPEELRDKGFETWFSTVFLPENLGDIKIFGAPLADLVDRGPVNAMTGLDVASRTGLNDLFGRDMKEMKTARDSFTAWALETFGGPSVSLGLGMIDAYEAYAEGDYQKAIEKSAPALIRNIVIANRYANEGIKDFRGSELVPVEAVTKGQLFGQAIGFRPDRAANAQAQAFKLTGIEQRTLNQRDRIMRMINIAHRKGDMDTVQKIMDVDVNKFNSKNPEYEIEVDDVYNSILKQTELRKSAQAGVNLTEKNARLMQEAVDNLKKSLERPEK